MKEEKSYVLTELTQFYVKNSVPRVWAYENHLHLLVYKRLRAELIDEVKMS